MPKPKDVMPRIAAVTPDMWKTGLGGKRFLVPADQAHFLDSLRALAAAIPDDRKKADFGKALAGDARGFFDGDGNVKPGLQDTIGALMTEAAGDRVAQTYVAGKPYNVYGRDDGRGGFAVSAVVPAGAENQPNPLDYMRLKRDAGVVTDVKQLPDVAARLLKEGAQVRGALAAGPSKLPGRRVNPVTLKDMLGGIVAKTEPEQRAFMARMRELAAGVTAGGWGDEPYSRMFSGDPKAVFNPDGTLTDRAKQGIADVIGGKLGKEFVITGGSDGKRYMVFGNTTNLGPFSANAVLPMEAVGKPDPLAALKVMPNAGLAVQEDQLPVIIDAINARGSGVGGRAAPAPAPAPAPAAVPPRPAAEPPRPAAEPPRPPAAAKVKVTELSREEVDRALDRMLDFRAADDRQKEAYVERLRKMARAMPPGAEQQKFMITIADPKTVFDGDGRPVGAVRDAFKAAFKENMGQLAFRVERGGKSSLMFGQLSTKEIAGVEGYDGFKVKAVIAEAELAGADAMDKLKTPLGGEKLIKFAGDEVLDEMAIAEGFELDDAQLDGALAEVDAGGVPVAAPAVSRGPAPGAAPAPGPAAAGRRPLGQRKSWYERLLNPGTMIGGLMGLLGGGLLGGGGFFSIIIGLLAGGLGGGFLSGNSPFSDKEQLTLAPADTAVQVRDKDGNAPVMEMTMAAGEPGKRMSVKGKASADGRNFEIIESVVVANVPGVPMERRRYDPPRLVAMDADGFIDTAKIYEALEKPVPVALRRVAGAREAAPGSFAEAAPSAGMHSDIDRINAFLAANGRDGDPTSFQGAPAPRDPNARTAGR